jgi:hypothetical protein
MKDWYVGDKLSIYLLLNISHKIFLFVNHVLEKKIPTNHHWNVIQFNKIQKKIIQIKVNFWKKNIFNHVSHWKYF